MVPLLGAGHGIPGAFQRRGRWRIPAEEAKAFLGDEMEDEDAEDADDEEDDE